MMSRKIATRPATARRENPSWFTTIMKAHFSQNVSAATMK
jgi:hypothetical protein